MEIENGSPNPSLQFQVVNAMGKIPEEWQISPQARDKVFQILDELAWKNPADFNIDQLAKLHIDWISQMEIQKKKTGPFYIFLRAFQEIDGAKLSQSVRQIYMMWCESPHFTSMSFEKFSGDIKNYANMRVHGHKRERVETVEMAEKRRENARERKAKAIGAEPNRLMPLLKLAASSAKDAPELYFGRLAGHVGACFRGQNWIANPKPYPGREHYDPSVIGKIWFGCMMAFERFRMHREGFETRKDVRLALHILADYLFLYIPWWQERNPSAKLVFPVAPKDFQRYIFVSRTLLQEGDVSTIERLPTPLLELLHLRRPEADTRNATVSTWHRFFEFISSEFDDQDEVSGKNFSNPIKLFSDKIKSKNRSKTDKIPFAEDVFPYIVLFCQALETFGEYLQQRAILENAFSSLPDGDRYGYCTQTWGYVPIIIYRGRVEPVIWMPNIYTVARRDMHSNPVDRSGIYVGGIKVNSGKNQICTITFPHLTVVRMLLGLVESGLRGQGMQWIDRNSWRMSNDKSSIEELHRSFAAKTFSEIKINTDKTKDDPWITCASWRVRRSFLAEQYFQEGLAEPNVDAKVNYENRDYSRFDPIVPLFRSHMTDFPYTDSTYFSKWIDLLIGFQNFYNNRNPRGQIPITPISLVSLNRIADASGSFVRVLEKNPSAPSGEILYCPLNYNAEYTPHCCRSTFASLNDGDLEVAEISVLIGHANTVTTNYYQIPSLTRLRGKLQALDKQILPEMYDATGKSPSYLHPEKPSSATRKAFDTNRTQAMNDFGFVSGVSLWSMSELGEPNHDALALLRDSPASIIRWHATHVCPVGDQCPREIVARIGGFTRCGLCPLAAKHIDHLTGIAAKKNELKERIRMTAKRIHALSRTSADDGTTEALHRSMELDTKELMGWELSTEILHDKLSKLATDEGSYHVDQPELVKRHLTLVTRSQNDSSFFLQRIADSNAYPILESAEVRGRALKYTRIILARAGKLDDAALLDIEPYGELAAFASLIKPIADSKGLTLAELAQTLDESVRQTSASPTQNAPFLLPGGG